MIAGYEDLPLIDGAPMLNDAPFWPTYLADTMAPHRDSLATAAFAVQAEDASRYFKHLTDPDAWPTFRLPLRDEYEIRVVYWNEPDEKGIVYFLCRQGQERTLDLANLGGHEFRPGLSWSELVTAANFSDATHGIVDPHVRLLLLLPAFGDADLPPEATAMVTAALTSCGAGPGSGDLAAYMLREPERWPHWRSHTSGALVCDGRYSRRNPEGPAGHSAADLIEISSALRSS